MIKTAPRILICTTLHWPIAARLAIAFANLGCSVESLCPPEHQLHDTRAVRKCYTYSAFRPLASLHEALNKARPDLVIPCDDKAAINLHRLYESLADSPSAFDARVIIERSVGTPAACSLATARAPLLALAGQIGVRAPKTNVVQGPGELSAWLVRRGFPAVIKIDNSSGGQGVSIVRNHEEALYAYQKRLMHNSVLSTSRRLLLERDSSALLNWLQPTRPIVNVQDFIAGTPANRAVACWRGEVLAGISVQALRTQHATGPATVVQVVQFPEMQDGAERIVRRLGLSGLWGFDYILESKTGAAYLIEINPRATPICHLSLGAGQDLPVALHACLTDSTITAPPAAVSNDIIALFPGEWQRNATSPYLRTAFHDVPWQEPALVRDGVDRPWSERGLLMRAWKRLRPKPPNLAAIVEPRDFSAARDKYVR